MATRPQKKAASRTPKKTARVVPISDFEDRMDGYIFTGAEADTHMEVVPADITFIREQIERHISQSPDLLGDFMVVMDHGNVDVRKWSWTYSGRQEIDPKRTINSFANKDQLVLFFDNKKIYWPKVSRTGTKLGIEWELMNPFTIWKSSKNHRPTYKDVVYAPVKYGEETNLPDTSLNLFQGWPLVPIMGQPEKCQLIRDHILNVICGGDHEFYQWMITWFAHKVQRPYDKIGTAISLRGRQGTGKGIFVSQIIGKILGQHFKHLININSVVGRFNAGFDDASLVYLDEAFFTRDKEAASALKGLITEHELTQEKKYKDPSTKAVVFDIIMSTNFEQAAPLEFDDRRYTIAEIEWDKTKEESHAYFAALINEIKDGGREAFFGLLLEWDLVEASVDIRKPYETAGRVRQKLTNLDPVPEWWFNVLTSGTFGKFSNGHTIHWEDWQRELIPRGVLSESCQAHCVKMRQRYIPPEASISKKVADMCPTLQNNAPRNPARFTAETFNGIGAPRQRAWLLPMLAEARADFEAFIGGPVDWGHDDTQLETSPEFEGDISLKDHQDDVPF